jgi:hypothetical protein
MAARGAWQVKARVVEAPQVMSLLVKVTGQVLLEALVKVVVKVLVEVEAVLLFSLSLQPPTQEQRHKHGLHRVFGLGALRVSACCVWPLHPAGVVLDPFPETRPLA